MLVRLAQFTNIFSYIEHIFSEIFILVNFVQLENAPVLILYISPIGTDSSISICPAFASGHRTKAPDILIPPPSISFFLTQYNNPSSEL